MEQMYMDLDNGKKNGLYYYRRWHQIAQLENYYRRWHQIAQLENSVKELNEELCQFSEQLHAFQMDVSSDLSVAEAKKFVYKKLQECNKELHAIVNNAGVRGNQFYDDLLVLEDYKEVWEVNIMGGIRVCQAFKQLIKKSKGRIIFCGSGATMFPIPGYGPYASSKAAVMTYADVLRHELRAYGVHIIVVQPGSFESGMQNTQNLLTMMDKIWSRCLPEIKEEYGEDFIVKDLPELESKSIVGHPADTSERWTQCLIPVKEVVTNLQSKVVSNNTKWVEDAYFHAISAKYPKYLYRIGWDTIIFSVIGWFPRSMDFARKPLANRSARRSAVPLRFLKDRFIPGVEPQQHPEMRVLIDQLTMIQIVVIFFILLRLYYIDKIQLNGANDKAVLITGSSSGFGKGIVEKCMNNGFTVFAACRTKQGVDLLEKSFEDKNNRLKAFVMDISNEEQVENARTYICDELELLKMDLHAVVNNAGIQATCFYDDMLDIADYEQAMNVNFYGTIRVIKAFKEIIKKSRGRLIVCTSSCVRFASPGLGPYTASKWALSGYSETIRHELIDFGVDVITIEPGIFCTSMNEVKKMMKMMNEIWAKTDKNLKKQYGQYCFNYGKRFYIKLREGAPVDLTPVINAYYHAITAKYPYKNYCIGVDAVYIYRPFSWLCARMQEIVMQWIIWIMGAPKPDIVE
ncbi:unnamed protein product [Dracunculus medinensis]|uniref:3-oxoacyl-[acyl-carrier-protein] reductase n=1 Tax=Dracunculus medinensis TaxID=318479 RepID=A0A0N4UC03_DRAME|nr:unnamed protein product [Dracunculus medinensis]